jgi:carboxypeptidase PM20D1
MTLPVALVGIAEKGHATLELRVEGRPGHSAAPPPHTAIGVMARAIARLEASPMPARLSMARLMFDELGAFLPFSMRLAFSNQWLFRGVIEKRMAKSAISNALVRTTSAATVVQGGVKDNILPASVSAAVNFRILPGDRVADVLAHARKAIRDDAVQINLPEFSHWEASPVSPVESPVYQDLCSTIREVFPEALVAPFLVIGATDSRYLARLTPSVFRFSPYWLDEETLRTVHGNNERVSIEALGRMVHFYTRLIQEWTES